MFDPMLVKPKCVWEAVVYLKNYKQTAEKWKHKYVKKVMKPIYLI